MSVFDHVHEITVYEELKTGQKHYCLAISRRVVSDIIFILYQDLLAQTIITQDSLFIKSYNNSFFALHNYTSMLKREARES